MMHDIQVDPLPADVHEVPSSSIAMSFARPEETIVFEEGDDTSLEEAQSGLARSNIVPSMDGILYWRQDHSSNRKLVPIASIRDLVENPIQLCQAEGNCDILTATSLGPSLFSLNSQGSLNWARSRPYKFVIEPVSPTKK